MAVTLQIRRGTAAQWTAANTVLAAGELGYETDTGFFKVGDGATAWNAVSYTIEGSIADLTVGPDAAPSGTGGLAYDSNTKTFTYTPPAETTTSIAKVGNELRYTDEDGTVTAIDLSLYLDDTNLARLASGTVDGVTGIATFTRDDATSFTVDFSDLLDDTNLARITSASWDDATGNFTLTRDDATTIITNLDGRYLQSETDPVFSAATVSNITDGTGYLVNDGAGNWSYDTNTFVTTIQGDVTGDLIPDTNEAYDLGTNLLRFRDLYLSGTSLYIGDAQITASSTSIELPSGSTIGGTAVSTVTDFADLTNTPTTIAGYGITDGIDNVALTSPADGELLMFNGVSWRNASDLTQKVNFLNGAQFRGETAYYWEELSVTGSPGHVQTYSMGSANRTGYFYITDMEHDMTINITNHEAAASNRQIFSIVVAVDNNNAFGGKICNAIQIDSVAQTVDWGYGNIAPTGTQGQVDVVEFVVYSTAGVGYTVIGRHWQKSGSDVFLVDGGTATSIYTTGDLELDGGSA